MYLGNIPSTSFEAVKKDRFTSLTGTGVTLSHSVSNVQDIVVWVNSVKQDYNNYTVSGTSLTLGGSLVSSDVVQVLYVGRTFQTVNPAADSVTASQIADNAISEEHLDPTIITGLTAEATVATDDTILIHDTSASALKKMTRANFVSGIGGANTPAFAATQANTGFSASADSKLTFATAIFDTDNCYDNSSNYRFTPTTAGKYFVFANIAFDADTTYKRHQIKIYKNGSHLARSQLKLTGSYFENSDTAANIHYVVDMNGSSDYLEIYGFLDQNGATVNTAGYGIFGAYRIIT